MAACSYAPSVSEQTSQAKVIEDSPTDSANFLEQHADKTISFGEYSGTVAEALEKCPHLRQMGETAVQNIVQVLIGDEKQKTREVEPKPANPAKPEPPKRQKPARQGQTEQDIPAPNINPYDTKAAPATEPETTTYSKLFPPLRQPLKDEAAIKPYRITPVEKPALIDTAASPLETSSSQTKESTKYTPSAVKVKPPGNADVHTAALATKSVTEPPCPIQNDTNELALNDTVPLEGIGNVGIENTDTPQILDMPEYMEVEYENAPPLWQPLSEMALCLEGIASHNEAPDTFAQFVEARPARNEELSIESIQHNAEEQSLEETLADLAIVLAEQPDEPAVEILAETIEDLSQAIETWLDNPNQDEVGQPLYRFLEVIGYLEPQETWEDFMSRHDRWFMVYAIRYLAQLTSQYRPELAVISDSDDTKNNRTKTQRLGQTILALAQNLQTLTA